MSPKIDLIDFTFMFPVRIDSVIRLENLICVISFLKRHINTNILVLEADKGTNNFTKRLIPQSVDYVYCYDDDPIFYRTYYINVMTKMVQTKFICIWDADVIIPANQILTTANYLRNDEADMAYPYDGCFLDVSRKIRELFINKKDIRILKRHRNKMLEPYVKEMKGGAVMVNREKYIQSGMENEGFYGWGPEDFERYERWKTLGYKIKRSEGCLFHLTHPRDINGTFNSSLQMRNSNQVYFITRNCSQHEIKQRLSV